MPANWEIADGGNGTSVDVKTRDFLAAVSLINDIAQVGQGPNHHPDLHLTRWNQLLITTHSRDAGKLTRRDEALATRINGVPGKRGLWA